MLHRQSSLVKWGTVAVTIVAGAWTLFHLVWNFTAHTGDDYWGAALLVLFILAAILVLVQFSHERSALKSASSADWFPEPAIAKFFLASKGSAVLWFVIRMEVGAQWLLSGWKKIESPTWGTSGKALHTFVANALLKASGPSPAVQGWYAWFLQHAVLPNLGVFSFMVTYGEFAVGLGVLLGVVTGIAASFGVMMNLNYLLAGSVSINPILGTFGFFLIASWRVCGWIGGDRLLERWLLPLFGMSWKPESQRQSLPKAAPLVAPSSEPEPTPVS